jgi:phosphoribosylformylglycinamidine (FGAM) synthase-like enzyme
LGRSNEDIGSSEYLHKIQGVEFSPAPHFDIEDELRVQRLVSALIKGALIRSAHDVSEGGLFVTLAESAFPNGLGFDVVAADFDLRKDAVWFGESQSRVVVSVKPEDVAAFRKSVGSHPHEELGFVTAGSFEVDGMDWGLVGEWKERYDTSIEKMLEGADAAL